MIAVTDRHLFDAEPDPEGAFLEVLAGLLNPGRTSPDRLSPGRSVRAAPPPGKLGGGGVGARHPAADPEPG